MHNIQKIFLSILFCFAVFFKGNSAFAATPPGKKFALRTHQGSEPSGATASLLQTLGAHMPMLSHAALFPSLEERTTNPEKRATEGIATTQEAIATARALEESDPEIQNRLQQDKRREQAYQDALKEAIKSSTQDELRRKNFAHHVALSKNPPVVYDSKGRILPTNVYVLSGLVSPDDLELIRKFKMTDERD